MYQTTDRLTLSLTDFETVCNVSDDRWKMVWTCAVFAISHSSDTLAITQHTAAQTQWENWARVLSAAQYCKAIRCCFCFIRNKEEIQNNKNVFPFLTLAPFDR